MSMTATYRDQARSEAAGNGLMARLAERFDVHSSRLMVLPAVLVLLAFSIFPLLASGYLALSRFSLEASGVNLEYVGWRNFERLLFGSQQDHFLGFWASPGIIGWSVMALTGIVLLRWLWRSARGGQSSLIGWAGRLLIATLVGVLLLLTVGTVSAEGAPGSLVTTLFYVVVGVSAQFGIGLGLALLCALPLRGKSFFRVVYFIPLMLTPVGIAYTFRMMADMSMGPLAPLWTGLGLGEFSWASDPWAARIVVVIADTWQWVPFMFLVLLAAVENQPTEQVEAARLDGAGPWDVFRDVTWPAIAPVAATVVLIRLIESFNIIDLPNVLTKGGPGIATESMTLHSFIAWRTQQLGESAAVGYMLLFIAVIGCSAFFNFVSGSARAHEREAA